MIPVVPKPEPATFDEKVRQPGAAFLKTRKPDQDLRTYWTRSLDELWTVYDGICAYMCTYIDRTTGALTVEHMKPKVARPDLAYEWSNFRLACSTMNGRKSNFENVLDPFDVKDGWFAIAFPACEVVPGAKLPASRRQDVETTIARLKLNDSKCLGERGRYFDDYLNRQYPFQLLERSAPFLACELERQKLRRPGD